jgi:hypothetical protein
MKTSSFFKILVPVTVVFFLAACDKVDDPTQRGAAKMAVVHAASGVSSIDVLLNNNSINNTSIPFGLASGSIGDPYVTVNSGINNLKINTAGNPLFQSNFLANANTYYSFFAYDTLGTGNAAAALLLTDAFNQTGTDSAQFRLLHLSHDAGAVDIELIKAGSGTLKIDSLTYVGSNANSIALSQFRPIRAGTYTLRIKNNETSVLILTSNINIIAGKTYTYFVKGSKAAAVGSTYAFGVGQLLHN